VKSSVDLISKEAVNSRYERSDVCAVPATSIVLTAVLGIELTKVVLEQFSGNTMAELERNYLSYKQQLESF
jgi:chorismate synthase